MNKKGLTRILILLGCLHPLPLGAQTRVSDSLVENLSCQDLNIQKIYHSIPAKAWQTSFHLPVKNWDFSAGLYDLAACWSLARTQRLFFYLARWGENPNMTPSQRLFNLSEMIRGTSPYTHPDEPDLREFPLRELFVFAQNETFLDPQISLWLSLQNGFNQDFPNGKKIYRNFKSEIEFYQKRRFHDFIRNIRYVIGDGARSVKKNRATRDLLLRNLEENKLTLLLLRPKRVSQHVVLAKSFEVQSNGDIQIWVYDSNSPTRDQRILFSQKDDEFYAPEIVRGLPKIENPQAALGVYIVDEGERELIEKTLVKHYQKKCR